MNKYLYWSSHTGEIYEVMEDEVPTLTAFQVRLKQRPPTNCKRCFGRFYESKNINTGLYVACQKCRKKCVDYDMLLSGM